MDSKSTESPNDHWGLWGEMFPVVICPQRPGKDIGQGTPQPSVCIELQRAEPGNGEEKASGYFVSIDAHAEECFFERVTLGTKMGLIFEVAEGSFLDIDV
ncbi:hypothetical protein E2I00_005140 [Balaenoptera physalus]|uniref:Uncharacterized protein n=1 Tax=Balaenoptera physalus TaxID=9770 RepID=A0A643C626_BALPH|nr:hypothetical protein E2I00_005140 [Balaenoptera physalus]